ncbi:MAG: PIN domain nuclease, partial [Thaumarchaeota archaeon]
GVTMYDAAYVALALLQDATLYTADENLLEKVSEFKRVRHVREFTL